MCLLIIKLISKIQLHWLWMVLLIYIMILWHSCFIVIGVCLYFVCCILSLSCNNKRWIRQFAAGEAAGRHVNHHQRLEIIWTIIPALILIAIALPSFALFYAMDDVGQPTLTVKVIGHQWYWSYEVAAAAEDNLVLVIALKHLLQRMQYQM